MTGGNATGNSNPTPHAKSAAWVFTRTSLATVVPCVTTYGKFCKAEVPGRQHVLRGGIFLTLLRTSGVIERKSYQMSPPKPDRSPRVPDRHLYCLTQFPSSRHTLLSVFRSP